MFLLKTVFFALCFLGFFSANIAFSETLWASRVLGFSSQYRDGGSPWRYAAVQALGKPNKLPAVGFSAVAWSPDKEDNAEDEYLHIAYDKSLSVRQIAIAENVGAGCVKKVILYDRSGREFEVFHNKNVKPAGQIGRIFHVFLNDLTTYEVVSVKIVLNTKAVAGWCGIDAVAISDSSLPVEAKINLAESRFSVAENLGAPVNSEADEVMPIISPDGKVLYFDRKNHPLNAESDIPGKPNDDIWYSVRNGDRWGEPVRFKEPLNTGRDNYVCYVTPDGNTLLLGNVYLRNGGAERGVSISKRGKDGNWQFPEAQIITDYYNSNRYAEFTMSPNRKIILMAIERSETFGDRDLYVSFLQENGIWSAPKNLGRQINTAETEGTPFLAADDRTLYFASSGHPGYGSMDIFVTKRLDDTWQNWSVPINLGPEINSEHWESSYSTDAAGEYVYFVSTKNSLKSSADLCRAKPAKETKPDPVVLMSGRVFNAKTKEPLAADIIYESLSDAKEIGLASSDAKTGEYKVVLPYRKKYGLWAKAKGFLSVHENIDLEMFDSFKEIVMDLYLVPLEVGSTIVLNNLFFKQGTSEILPESLGELERIALLLTENPKLEIELGGHTDTDGIPLQNFKLSQGRVDAVKSFLVKKGIDEKRVQTKAYGQTKPLTRDRDEESKKKNRRVEFTVLKNS